MKLTPEQLLDLAARAPMGDLCILRHPERPDGMHDTARMAVRWALDLVAAVNEAMPEDAQPESEVQRAVAAERERCAEVCLSLWDLRADERARMHAAKCADAIRRSNDPEPEFPEPDYPWAEHPDLKWMATDLDGSQWGYSADAAPGADGWAALDEKGVMRIVDAGSGRRPHWRETKRRRPEGV